MYSLEDVRTVDPEIAACIEKEQKRQNSHIELIASENWVSKAVMAAMGSPLTNKYAEGYPGKRFYDVHMLMFSLIPVRRQIWQSFLQC